MFNRKIYHGFMIKTETAKTNQIKMSFLESIQMINSISNC